MAYLPQFKHDVFISYRRASNEGADAWVDGFCDQVRIALKDLVGDVAIWRDTAELRAGELWRPEIAEAVDSTGVFLALISRTYFDSDECRKELDRFLGRLKRPDAAGRKLVPVYKHPTKPDQSLPPELAEIGHHEFFNREPKPWRELDPRRDADDYQERLGRVVFDLMEALEKLQGQHRAQARGQVFVAAVGPELLQARDRLRTDLRQRGWLVLPEHEYLWNADDHRARITADLAQAQLCVHLVSRQASLEPATPQRSRLQLDLAHAEMQRRGLPAPLVWIQPAEATDASAQPLIAHIEGTLANEGIDHLQGSLEDLKTLLLERLPRPAPPPATAALPLALLVHEAALADIAALRSLLAEQLGAEPRPLKFDASAQPRDAERAQRTLAASPQALICWTDQDEDWVMDLLDHPALAARRGPQRLGLVRLGPGDAARAGFRTAQARLMDAQAADFAATLAAFLAEAPALPAGGTAP